MSREAMRQALEALEKGETKLRWAAISALKQALAEHDRLAGIEAIEKDAGIHVSQQAEPEQEPVAWEQFYPDIGKPQTTHWEGCEVVHPECRKPDTDCHAQGICQRSGYTLSPTPRKPLTEEELEPLFGALPCYDIGNSDLINFARAVIAAYEAKQGEQT